MGLEPTDSGLKGRRLYHSPTAPYMAEARLELARTDFVHEDLNLACIPVPPLSRLRATGLEPAQGSAPSGS